MKYTFNPKTKISFSILEERHAEISIYNIKGQKIKQLISDQLSAGEHSVVWDGRDEKNQPVGSGIYFYRLLIDGKSKASRKMILMK